MAVAKYKLKIDRELRAAGCIVKSGRIYRPDGVFWGTRSEFIDWTRGGPDRHEKCIAAIAQHVKKD